MASDNADNDLLTFSDEPETRETEHQSSWLILIIDDEPSVHDATRLALRGIIIEGRPLTFLHAFTAAEARAILARGPVAQTRFIPLLYGLRIARRNAGTHLRPALLQQGVAAAMVAVQVGVDNALQRRALQGRFNQRQRLLGVDAIAGIDHRCGALREHGVIG